LAPGEVDPDLVFPWVRCASTDDQVQVNFQGPGISLSMPSLD
jgi:hypothetical protein